jgi:hypothetical protein
MRTRLEAVCVRGADCGGGCRCRVAVAEGDAPQGRACGYNGANKLRPLLGVAAVVVAWDLVDRERDSGAAPLLPQRAGREPCALPRADNDTAPRIWQSESILSIIAAVSVPQHTEEILVLLV